MYRSVRLRLTAWYAAALLLLLLALAAGTYFGLVWALAVFGVTMKACNRLSQPWLSTGLYLVMGWLALIAAVPLIERVALPGLQLIVAGGIAYTAGVVFVALDSRLRYAHTVWHGFVIAGSGLHAFAVLHYAA